MSDWLREALEDTDHQWVLVQWSNRPLWRLDGNDVPNGHTMTPVPNPPTAWLGRPRIVFAGAEGIVCRCEPEHVSVDPARAAALGDMALQGPIEQDER